MNTPYHISSDNVFRFIEHLMFESKKRNEMELFKKLDDALNLGSSALEILGAIRAILVENRSTISKLFDSKNIEEADSVIAFVDTVYGR